MQDVPAHEAIAPYYQHLPAFAEELANRGSQGLVVLDASAMREVEDEYGSQAYQEVRQRLFKLLVAARGKDYRTEDLLTLDRPGGRRFILFLGRKRRQAVPATVADLRAIHERLATTLAPHLARAAFPYLKSAPRVEVGYSMAIHNPLVHPQRIAQNAIDDALRVAAYQRTTHELLVKERLLDLILRERVVTAYQAIADLESRTVLAFEALSRGPQGSGLERADTLFAAAAEHGLMVELDRLCRQRALLGSGRIPSTARIFVNTLPSTVRDPQFRGRALIDLLERAKVAPSRIVLEITENLMIENYGLFREAMDYFTDLGMSFAVDDVGAGYAGLESIARLKPTFLKIDIALVRDIHTSLVNRQIVKAIVAMGHGTGATVIAEGIQTEDEARTLMDLGVEWGQGYLLGRPEAGPE